MNRIQRKKSVARTLVVATLLCSIVCSVMNIYGSVGTSQRFKVIGKLGNVTQVTSQIPEKVESETGSRHYNALFVIQTVAPNVFSDVSGRCAGLAQSTRFGGYLNSVPLYLVEKTFRI